MSVSTVFFTQAFNAQHTIRRTIDSILNQSRGDLEYYVLDNGSTDDIKDIIPEYGKKDDRVKPLRVNTNDITNGGAFFSLLVRETSAKYIALCDADDEYTPDFLENMIRFSEENHLDIAACGYDKIDGVTGEVLKHRALDENLVLHDNLFADEFIKYRGFTTYLWGKLYSIDYLRNIKGCGTERENRICNDSIWTLRSFQKSGRAGVYGKAMYKYYQYPRSLSRTNIVKSISSYSDLWGATKKFLEHFGPVSKLNEDFLYAIHLSLVEEAANNVLSSELPADVKLDCLLKLFSDPAWDETLTHDADPQFRNLAARDEYVSQMKSRILALPGAQTNGALTADVLRVLERK